jgi:hypothetical protein
MRMQLDRVIAARMRLPTNWKRLVGVLSVLRRQTPQYRYITTPDISAKFLVTKKKYLLGVHALLFEACLRASSGHIYIL